MSSKVSDKGMKTSDKRDISSYVCRLMVYGAISGHGIKRDMIEELCRRYSDEHPKTDITKLPVLMVSDKGDAVNRTLYRLVKEFCSDAIVESQKGNSVLLVGEAAKELVSSLKPEAVNMTSLMTKVKVSCQISPTKKFKCFNNHRLADYIPTEDEGKVKVKVIEN